MWRGAWCAASCMDCSRNTSPPKRPKPRPLLPEETPMTLGTRNSRDETLPGWTYDNAEFFALEREHLLLSSWTLAGHRSDLKAPGDFLSVESCGERGLVVLGEDDKLRGFFNTCRHRAHALVSAESGSCGHAIRCPYHGWTYDFEGRLKAIAADKSFPTIDKAEFGLRPIEVEEFLGFVFVRFKPGGMSV